MALRCHVEILFVRSSSWGRHAFARSRRTLCTRVFAVRLFAPSERPVPVGVVSHRSIHGSGKPRCADFWGRIRIQWYFDDHSCCCPFLFTGLPHFHTITVNTTLHCTDSLRFSCVPPHNLTARRLEADSNSTVCLFIALKSSECATQFRSVDGNHSVWICSFVQRILGHLRWMS
jgi:hypothetical protein